MPKHLALRPFVKTTGGKGLHIVVPLDAEPLERIGWPVAKAVARAICVAMGEKYPDRFIVSMAKKRRTGRIFLDYLRNDRTATAITPLSPRVRIDAMVSMPLTWSQMTKRLAPKRFTIRTPLRSSAKATRGMITIAAAAHCIHWPSDSAFS